MHRYCITDSIFQLICLMSIIAFLFKIFCIQYVLIIFPLPQIFPDLPPSPQLYVPSLSFKITKTKMSKIKEKKAHNSKGAKAIQKEHIRKKY